MARQDDYTRYTIRIPTDLYERVKASSGEASVNSTIVAVLEEKFPPPVGGLDAIRQEIRHLFAETNGIVDKLAAASDPEEVSRLQAHHDRIAEEAWRVLEMLDRYELASRQGQLPFDHSQ